MGSGIVQPATEEALLSFLRPLPEPVAPRLRSLAHAWAAAGGTLQVGRFTIRLVAAPMKGRPYTAGTLHANHPEAGPALELARVLLTNHGVSSADWSAWSDELAEMHAHGFTAGAKFPTVSLAAMPDVAAARLAQGLRDLGRLAHGQPA